MLFKSKPSIRFLIAHNNNDLVILQVVELLKESQNTYLKGNSNLFFN
jgi:hypothetical protein